MWAGRSDHTLDAKNRVFLPKRFLAGLDPTPAGERPRVYLTLGFEGCLFLFSVSGFHAATAALDTGVFESPEARRRQRAYFSQSLEIELDAHFRLLLPEPLTQQAGIDKEVVVLGAGRRIELWGRERWEREQQNLPEFDSLGHAAPPGAGE
jgi:MraZ protein